MHWILVGAILTGLFVDAPLCPRLDLAPIDHPPRDAFVQTGLAVFDLEVDAEGAAATSSPLYGQPPFMEPSRLSFSRWKFREGDGEPVHVSATFLYRPILSLPTAASVIEVPLPESADAMQSPFPRKIVDPGYPFDGRYSGVVVVQAGLDADGNVENIRVLSEAPTLTAAATSAVRQWKFHVPAESDARSRTTIVTIHFQSPEISTPPEAPPSLSYKSVVAQGAEPGVPTGVGGVLSAGDPMGLTFGFDESNWVMPYALVRGIELVEETSKTSRLTVRFSSVEDDDAVTFRMTPDDGLELASVLSARSRTSIRFGSGTAAVCVH
jgi:TonB family protein